MSRTVLLLACFLLAHDSLCNASDPPLLKINSQILDSKVTRVPVGGDNILGFIQGDPAPPLDLQNVIALLPMHSNDALCARVTSRNGEFKIALAYDVRNVRPGEYRLEFRSKYTAELDRLLSNEVAILLWLSNSCDGTIPNDPELVLATWGPYRDLHKAYLYQNTGRLSARLVDLTGNPVNTCVPLPRESVSFDTQCEFPISPGKTQALSLQLIHFGSVQDAISIHFELP